jgi:hypothetical protein
MVLKAIFNNISFLPYGHDHDGPLILIETEVNKSVTTILASLDES